MAREREADWSCERPSASMIIVGYDAGKTPMELAREYECTDGIESLEMAVNQYGAETTEPLPTLNGCTIQLALFDMAGTTVDDLVNGQPLVALAFTKVLPLSLSIDLSD